MATINRTKVAILGSGNIGTDLMYKIRRSPSLQLTWVAGIVPDSEGLQRAKNLGHNTTHHGIEGLLEHGDDFEIVFDATSAYTHRRHAKLLDDAKKIAIDLTPAAVGPCVVPPVNLSQHLGERNVNLVTCGGQATTPIVAAIARATKSVLYAEIISTVSSRSAGPGTRQNIDEFTETTGRALASIGGAEEGKAIMILNPANPPIIMRNTVYALVDEVDQERITESVTRMVESVQRYVPGYRLKSPPLFDGNRVTVLLEVCGAGDYLPEYAGNLDIMTAAAVRVGEEFGHQSRSRQMEGALQA